MLMLCGALALHNAVRLAPVPLVEELRARYGADYTGIGNVIGAYTLAYGFAQLLAGLLTARFGPKRLMLIGLTLATLGSALFAVTADYAVAVTARLLVGTAGGFLYTPTIAYTFAAFDPLLRGRAMGVAEAGVGAGQILAILLLPVLFEALGLTGAFLALPVAALTLWLAVGLGLPPLEPERRRGSGHFLALARDPDFWLLLVGVSFIGMLAQVATFSWMPTYLRQVHGFGVIGAGASTGIVLAGLMVFSPLFGALSDRLTSRRPVMLIGSVLALAGWLVLLTTPSAWMAIAAAFLVSASMAATIPMQVVFTSERFAAIGAGTAIGIVNTGGQLASSIGGPLYGAMLDHGLGFGAVWGTAAGLGVIRIVVVLLLREQRRPPEP
jgi:MFS transporter, DHA1 family, inner membrane transport protein